jgi:hypothetical protein
MKRRQPIQPAPQAAKPVTCPCGVEVHIQHTCRWRPPPTNRTNSTVARRNDTQREGLARLETAPLNARRRIMIFGGLPSARRRSKALATPNSALDPSQRQVRLKGMPADVFHPEPFNAYPIPTIGCVHRMVEHCKLSWPFHQPCRDADRSKFCMCGLLSKASHLRSKGMPTPISPSCGRMRSSMLPSLKVW